ncbi:MAG TPA: hypothetical protein VH913_13260 [Hyphomicrobiaceae bacterium]|jgi:hypothetical protein
MRPDELTDDLLEQLVSTLKAPQDQKVVVAGFLRTILEGIRRSHAHSKNWKERDRKRLKELNDFAKIAASLRAKIDKLSTATQQQLGLLEWSPARHQLCCMLERIVEVNAATQPEPRAPNRPTTQLGKPGARLSPFESLIMALYVLQRTNGCRVRVDPLNRTGTLVDFLKRATPILPEGFIPPHLWEETSDEKSRGWKRLQRIGTMVRRMQLGH